MDIQDIITALGGLPEADRELAVSTALEQTKDFVFVPQPGPQTEAYFSEADVLLFGGSPGGGKLLDSDTYVPVPLHVDARGWKRHGDIKEGDHVYSPTGDEVLVFARHDTVKNPDAYELELDTGEVFLADAQHYWLTWDRNEREQARRCTEEWRAAKRLTRKSRAKTSPKSKGRSETTTRRNRERHYDVFVPTGTARTTKQIADTLRVESDHRLNHSIAVTQPLRGREESLPVDPYLYGLWLGDGYTNKPCVIMLTSDWLELDQHTPVARRTETEPIGYKGRKQEVQIRHYRELLPFSRKSAGGKRIPPEYLRASYRQRLELLRGMCDTDGTCDPRGQVELGFSNKELAHDAHELINSLGIKTSIRRKEMRSDKHAAHWRMKFIAKEPVFKLPRKAARQKAPERPTTNHRYIVRVEKAPPKPMNCLTVEGRLYLVGRSFVTTHNTALGMGLALNEHHRTMVVRKNFVDLTGCLHTLDNILKTPNSATGGNRPVYRKSEGGIIEFVGLGDDLDGKQGNPHDFIYVDEAAQLPETQVRMLMGWLRTDKPGQRCRVVMGSNPPLDSVGDWLIEYFAPWLDPQHPNPAEEGELRYFQPKDDGQGYRECEKDDFIEIHGVRVAPQSRTFISSKFTDNAFYDAEQYAKSLAGLPDSVRERLTTGNFLLDRTDDIWQLIPTQWAKEAQARWKPQPPAGVPMCAIAIDVAQGGSDTTAVSPRHDAWFAKLIVVPGKETPDGKSAAGVVIKHRRDNAPVIVDLGGGWGGDCYGHLKENGVDATGYLGVKATAGRSVDGKLGFTNVRTKAYWRFREALDPSQPGGSSVALPPDSVLLADLCAPRYRVTTNGIEAESKKDVVKRLGRSTDRGDAVVMCWSIGIKAANIQGGFAQYGRNRKPQVVLGHRAARRK